MFDIGWSEIIVIAVVAIVVVGPKELPRMLRSFGKTMGQVRKMSNDFKRQFDEALREAERGAGLEDTKKQLQAMAKPLTDVRKDLDATMRSATAQMTPKPTPSPTPDKPDAMPHAAEPAKTGAATPAHGSDAA
jgi:sec-independent protein translocase protein TatB